MSYYTIWSPKPLHQLPCVLLEEDSIDNNVGFRSVYSFDYDTAAWIDTNGSIKGIGRTEFSLYSDTLFVDFDDEPASAEILVALLEDWGIGCTVYDSGSRSVHFHIDIVPMEGKHVAHSQLMFMTNLFNVYGIKADLTLYRPNSLYRLEHTIHTKTGRPKVLLETLQGNKLHIETVELGERAQTLSLDAESVSNTFWRLMMTHVTAAQGRSMHVFKLLSQTHDLGMDQGTAMQHIEFWNNNYSEPPLEPEKLNRKKVEMYG